MTGFEANMDSSTDGSELAATAVSCPALHHRLPRGSNIAKPEATSVPVQVLMPPGTLRQEPWPSLCTALHILSPPDLQFATSR